jgi:hypothetical protein
MIQRGEALSADLVRPMSFLSPFWRILNSFGGKIKATQALTLILIVSGLIILALSSTQMMGIEMIGAVETFSITVFTA